MSRHDFSTSSLTRAKKNRGPIGVALRGTLQTMHDLSVVYTPGVAAVSSAIAKNPRRADDLTWKRNAVAVVSDGSAVLGLGNIGPLGALPVMSGKCAIFKRFAGIDAVPLVLGTQDPDQIVAAVTAIAPTFGAIQLEDISAPRCFDIEDRLHHALDIPVMHDDQHGTAIIVLAGLLNAVKIVKKPLKSLRVVMSGAGAAGTGVARMLRTASIRNIVACDRKGAIYQGRPGLNDEKKKLASITNLKRQKGELADVIRGADVLIGISGPGVVTSAMVRSMAKDSIVFALANPVPEIMPDVAKKAGARVIATGRSDFPNQINNALCYPGLFRGMLDKRIPKVTDAIKLRAAHAIAGFIKHPTPKRFIPNIFDKGLHQAVARSVR